MLGFSSNADITRINPSSALAQGLLANYVMGPNGTFVDTLSSQPLQPTSAITYNGTAGLGKTPLGVFATRVGLVPFRLRIVWPITFDVWFSASGNPPVSVGLSTVTYNDPVTSPFTVFGLGTTNTTPPRLRAYYNSNGGFGTYDASSNQTWTGVHHALINISSASQYLAYDGQIINSRNNTISNPTYTATSYFQIGISSNTTWLPYCLRVWNRSLSSVEVAALYNPQSRWSMYQQPLRRWFNTGISFLPRLPLLGVG